MIEIAARLYVKGSYTKEKFEKIVNDIYKCYTFRYRRKLKKETKEWIEVYLKRASNKS